VDKRLPLERIFSAGGIVIKDEKILVTQHSGHLGWSFPKGQIEKGEKNQEAALREVGEEAGVVAEILEKLGQTQYFYVQDGKKVFKTVIWFLMKYESEGEAKTAWEVSGKKWLALDEVEGQLTFKSDKEFWKENLDKIQKVTSNR
jgi:8-oxo-dGTP diphosphatase